MKALVLEKKNTILLKTVPLPSSPGPHQVVLSLHASALNRRDYWISRGLYPNIKFPAILGSDGCGEVVQLGPGVDPSWLNRNVVVNPSMGWGNDQSVADLNFNILGMPTNGTHSEFVVVDVDRLYPKPYHMTNEQAAALPLAGLTAYRALIVKGEIKSGQKLLVPSIGSGVSQFVAQFGVAIGAEVWVTSSSDLKLEKSIEMLNLKGGVNYKSKDWVKDLLTKAGKFDVIVDGAGGENFTYLVNPLLKNGGKLVTYGATAGTVKSFPLHMVFLQHKSILGTTMGSDKDFSELMSFVTKHKIVPLIASVHPLSQVKEAIESMQSDNHFGKFVISIKNSKL